MTPEQEDARHFAVADTDYEGRELDHLVCDEDRERWPCVWEQRRAHLAAALRVVEAARSWNESPSFSFTESLRLGQLREALCYFDDWEREHAPREGVA